MKALVFAMICLETQAAAVTYLPDSCNSTGTTYTLEVVLSNATDAVMVQVHSLRDAVEVVDLSTNETVAGHHAGTLRYTQIAESEAAWSVRSAANRTVNALVLVTLYRKDEPVPGACNQEFLPDNEPNLYFNESLSSDLAVIEFAAGNVGSPKGVYPPLCDTSSSPALNLEYTLYIYYLPPKDYSEQSMFKAVESMITPKDVARNGRKAVSMGELDQKKIYVALFKDRGTVITILLYDNRTKTTSAYVPYVNYACDDKSDGNVCTYTDMGPTLVYTFCGLSGVILCFLGHWIFLYEMYMFGFLPTVIGVYMVLSANTGLLPFGIMTLSITLGFLGGVALMGMWWRFGRATPTALWISLVLGYHLSSVLFFTPFGYMSVWRNTTAFGLAFACGMLVVPIFGLIFQRWVSLLASAVIGSYMVIAPLSFFFGGVIQYINQNVVHRASSEHFDEAVYVLPGNPVDYILGALWCFLTVLGVASQNYLTREADAMPPCPYKAFKERRVRYLRSRVGEGQLTSGVVNSSENEHTPLLAGDL